MLRPIFKSSLHQSTLLKAIEIEGDLYEKATRLHSDRVDDRRGDHWHSGGHRP